MKEWLSKRWNKLPHSIKNIILGILVFLILTSLIFTAGTLACTLVWAYIKLGMWAHSGGWFPMALFASATLGGILTIPVLTGEGNDA